MAGSSPIIVGGGIQQGSPFTLNELLWVSNVSPPSVTTMPAKHALDGVVEYISIPSSASVYPATAGATETLRIRGGMIVEGTADDTVQIGRAAVGSALHSTVIGATATDGFQVGVVIGYGAAQSASAGVVVGIGAVIGGTAGGSTGIAIGAAANATNAGAGGGDSTAIGNGAIAKQSDVCIGGLATSSSQSAVSAGSVVIGYLSAVHGSGDIAVGQNASCGAGGFSHNSIAIGASASIGTGVQNLAIGVLAKVTGSGANNIIIGAQSVCSVNANVMLGGGLNSATANLAWFGGPTTPLYYMIFGEGDTVASPTARLWRFTNASGTNNAAGTFTIAAPNSTGNATAGNIIFQIGQAHGSDAVLQTQVTMFQLGDQKIGFFGATPVAKQVSGGLTAGVIAGLVALGLFSS